MWKNYAEDFLKISTIKNDADSNSLQNILNQIQNVKKEEVLWHTSLIRKVLHHSISGHFSIDSSHGSSLLKVTAKLVSICTNSGLESSLKIALIFWLSETLNFYIKSLKKNGDDTTYHECVNLCLQTVQVILKDYQKYDNEVIESLAGNKGSLISVLESKDIKWLSKSEAIQCLHLLTYAPPEVMTQARQSQSNILTREVVSSVQRVVVRFLQQPLPSQSEFPQRPYLRTTASCLGILYNLVICAPDNILGNTIVGTCRPFIFHGLPGFSHEELIQDNTPEMVDVSVSSDVDSDAISRNYTNRNRRKRLRRKRAQPTRVTNNKTSSVGTDSTPIVLPQPPDASSLQNISLKPQWAVKSQPKSRDSDSAFLAEKLNKDLSLKTVNIESQAVTENEAKSTITTSTITPRDNFYKECESSTDMEVSDADVKLEKISTLTAEVRQHSLQAINSVIQKVGNQHKFSYWPQLMCQDPSLMTSILYDPSSAVRMTALQVINTFLMDSSNILSIAVDDESKGAYASLSYQLGSSLRELHRCLALALLSEKCRGGLVRTLKTIELLVENVNYSKLRPGLLTKVVTHVKYFMKYNEAVVRANAFSVMVSVLMIKPQIPELQDLLVKYSAPIKILPPVITTIQDPLSLEEVAPDDCLSDDDSDDVVKNINQLALTSEDEGNTEDNKSDDSTMVSWLIQRCVHTLLSPDKVSIHIQVQLQSLKVLSSLVSEHLKLIVTSLPSIQHVIVVCCNLHSHSQQTTTDCDNKDSLNSDCHTTTKQETQKVCKSDCRIENSSTSDLSIVVEYSCLLLGSLMGAVKNELHKDETTEVVCITTSMAVNLWLWSLQGPLQPLLISLGVSSSTQDDDAGTDTCKQYWTSKKLISASDVLAQIHPKVLESLDEETLDTIVACIHCLVVSEDPELQLSGVRVMAVLVNYPTIQNHKLGKELVRATARSTIKILAKKNSNVNRDRLLASWALANISAVLHMFCDDNSSDFLLDQNLISQMIDIGLKACHEIDKIKPHGVRCVGNLISILQADQVEQLEPKVREAITTLIHCASNGNNMKMRWNACHALGTILNCHHLLANIGPWKKSVFSTLCSLVENFKNYKVRFQACCALCGLPTRQAYGIEYINVWKALLKGLDNSQNIYDYHEIKHRDELINQLSQGICQMITLLELQDAGEIKDLLELHQDTAKALIHKTYDSLPPEKATYCLKAHERIVDLLSSDALTEAQDESLQMLKKMTDIAL